MAKPISTTRSVASSTSGLKAHLRLPSRDRLLQLLRYDSASGKLYWKPRGAEEFRSNYRSAQANADSWNSRYANNEAFVTPDGYGYLCGSIDDVKYQAHRIIWKMLHDAEPEFIDHDDGNRANNREQNLFDVTHAINQKNQKKFVTNTSGETGVCWSERKKRWVVRMRVDGKQKQFGSFIEFADAVAARRKAAVENGYHPNHGIRQ